MAVILAWEGLVSGHHGSALPFPSTPNPIAAYPSPPRLWILGIRVGGRSRGWWGQRLLTSDRTAGTCQCGRDGQGSGLAGQ